MAVYTKLNFQEIVDFLKLYSLGNLISFKEIIDGIDNSNFIIQTDLGKFVLTIFEKRISKNDLPFFMDFKLHLANRGISCPKPIKNNQGLLISFLKSKPAAIVTFLEGSTLKPEENGLYKNIIIKNCFEVGRLLALLHIASADFKLSRENDLGVMKLHNLFSKISNQIETYQAGLQKKIDDNIKYLEDKWPKNLDFSRLTIHSDLFPDNVFFDGKSNLVGVIDFYFSATDFLIYDIAVAVNAWCFDENNNFVNEKFVSLINGYQSLKMINQKEKEFLKLALIGASMRFFLTRMYDLINTPQGSLVKIKDPREYQKKLEFFLLGNVNL